MKVNHIFKATLLAVLMLFSIDSIAQVNQWRDIYEAKKKDTVFGIARKYGISVPDLMDANPEMKKEGYELKKGYTIFIPFVKKQTTETTGSVKTQTPLTKEPAKPQPIRDLDITKRAIRIGVMLPLHDVDGDGRRMVEYYRGLLLACDDLKARGISTDIHAWNVPIDADIRQTLLDPNAKRCDIIFGPLYTKHVKSLGDFCKKFGIKMVIPFSIEGGEVANNPQIFQIYQSADSQAQDAIRAYLDLFMNHHPVFIDCNDAASTKGIFTFPLRKQLEAKGIKYSITNLKSSEEAFVKSFSLSKPNVVILNTGRSPELNVALAKIDGLKAANPTLSVSLFGYTEWLMYTKVYFDYFCKYETYIPAVAYYNALSPQTRRVEQKYHQWFKEEMQGALPRFALTGYDQANYFCQGLHRYGMNFSGSKAENTCKPLQTPLHFRQVADGGMQNVNFMLIHYKHDRTIDSITY